VLKPELAVEAVYKIIDDNEINNRLGHIKPSDFKRLWSDKHHIDFHTVLKEMLKEFKVAFSKRDDNEAFILPALLSSIPSDMKWSEKPYLTTEFEYSFMPKALVNQLSADLSEYIHGDKYEVWNNAVNLTYGNTAKCQVREDFYSRTITIKASGEDARPLVVLAMDSLKRITSAYRGVTYDINIPCTCNECAKGGKHVVKHSYDDLMRLYAEKGRTTAYCIESAKQIPVDELIFKVGLPLPFFKIERFDDMKEITIFLASSNELKDERESFERFIGRENKQLSKEGIFLHLVIWEDFLNAMSPTRLQDEYNKKIRESDIFVGLFFSKVGKYTSEEFDTAYDQFINTGKPYIFTFFKNAPLMSGDVSDDINSLLKFKEKLNKLGHFPTSFNDSNDLERQFRSQFDKLKDKL